MADVIKEEDVARLVGSAINLINEERYSPIEIIKRVKHEESCSLSEAKEAYSIAKNNESLSEYQERVILPLLSELNEPEEQGNSDQPQI
ncbi:MAG: hypothetical protein Tsb002_15390 [Wenzhouxiangellaceae bacterium]